MISFETRALVYYRFQSGQGEVEEVNRLSPYPVSEEFICVFLQDWEYNIDKVNKVNRVTIWILMIVSLRGDYMDGVVFLLTWQRYSRRGLILYPKKFSGMVFQFSINYYLMESFNINVLHISCFCFYKNNFNSQQANNKLKEDFDGSQQRTTFVQN